MPSCIVLLPSYEQALQYRKEQALAANSGVLFGAQVTTFSAWVEDAWGLYGDGRAIIGPVGRQVFLGLVCDNGADVQVAQQLIPAVLGLERFEAALSGSAAALSAEEQRVLQAVAAYRAQLKRLGYIEVGDVLSALPSLLPQKPTHVLVLQDAPLSLQQVQFFNACPWITLEHDASNANPAPVKAPEYLKLQFAFPSGNYAWPALAASICTGQGSTAIACKQPLALYEKIAPHLSECGVTCAVKGSILFSQTDFGRAYFSVVRFLADAQLDSSQDNISPDTPASLYRQWDRSNITDYLLSPFSGFNNGNFSELNPRTIFSIDAQLLRGDRTVKAAEVANWLRAKTVNFSYFEDICQDPESATLLRYFEDIIRENRNASESWKTEQLAALSLLRSVGCAVSASGQAIDVAHRILNTQQVYVARTTAQEGARPQVLVGNMAALTRLPAHSYDTLVMADMTSDDYPVSSREDAAISLLAKLGLALPDTPLAQQRRSFNQLLKLPTKRLIIERPLNDAATEPTYAAAVVEDFIDCYRSDPSATDDIDNIYALPKNLQDGLLIAGEETLYHNATLNVAPAGTAASVAVPQTGHVSAHNRPLIVLPRPYKGVVLNEPSFSPSQIESYLECPYKWFAQRRLRLDDIDEGFGPVEMGEFAHSALHSFYKHFTEETGQAKVTLDTVAKAKEIMQDVLTRHEAYQAKIKARDTRLIPTTQLELREVDALKQRLLAYLDYEAKLLPNFHPELLEYDIAKDQQPTYAGYKIVGTADRVDVDSDGRFVVIDYKGSVGDSFALSKRKDGYLGKVQALIYAQVLRRSLGRVPVGALYVCYGRRPCAAGAYENGTLSENDLPYVKPSQCAWPLAGTDAGAGSSFSDLLDQTEEAVALALERMLAGDIAPKPAVDSACKWCPVSSCPERMA